jgi:uncharacterized membrane protein YdjX (TVP38/TMEM64 family)
MSFTLPPKFDSLQRIVAHSHKRRIMIWLAIMIPFLVIGVVFSKSNVPSWLFFGFAILTVFVGIFGMIYVSRLDKQQSVTLGFVCPLCGGGLYCWTNGRLWVRGECPHCKHSIIKRLSE